MQNRDSEVTKISQEPSLMMEQQEQPAWAALQSPLTSLPPLPARQRDVSRPTFQSETIVGPLHRTDGRQSHEMRRIFFKTGVVQRAEGSCYLSQGKTRLMCSIFGPKSNRLRNRVQDSQEGEIIVEVTFSPFCQSGLGRVTRAGGGQGQASRSLQDVQGEEVPRLSNCIVQAFQSVILTSRFPNASVEIALLVIQNDGSLFSAAINCVSLALADARIPMKDICTSASVVMFDLRPSSQIHTPKEVSAAIENSCFHKIVDQRNEVEDSHQPSDLVFLIDPTLDELFYGPFFANSADLFSENHSTSIEGATVLAHVGLCSSDMSVAFLDVAGLPLEPPIDVQLLQLAESACCATARAFKEQLRASFLEKQAKEKMESQMSSELLTIATSMKGIDISNQSKNLVDESPLV